MSSGSPGYGDSDQSSKSASTTNTSTVSNQVGASDQASAIGPSESSNVASASGSGTSLVLSGAGAHFENLDVPFAKDVLDTMSKIVNGQAELAASSNTTTAAAINSAYGGAYSGLDALVTNQQTGGLMALAKPALYTAAGIMVLIAVIALSRHKT